MKGMKSKSKSAKKALLKKIVGKNTGSPFKLDNGLGKTPIADPEIGSGAGSNLGTNGIF